MNEIQRLKRRKDISFAVGMASIDGGRPSSFTEKLLAQYENGLISSKELKKEIEKKYTKVTQ